MILLPLLASPVAHAGRIACNTPHYLALREVSFFGGSGRPTSIGSIDSALFPIRIHYEDAADIDRITKLVLPAAEAAWDAEMVQMGWPVPPADNGVGGSDAYDIYMTSEGTWCGAYTYGFSPDTDPYDGFFSNPTYIAIDRRPCILDSDMPGYVAHELNHASHYTIDAWERTIFAWESTAEAITDIVVDDTDYGYELPSFQMLPWASLVFDSYANQLEPYYYEAWYYEYGGMLFGTYLEERFGTKDGTKLRDLWFDLAQTTSTDEPDFLDALALVDPTMPSAAEIYADFSTWRMFASTDDDGAHYEEASTWDTDAIVAVEESLALDAIDGAMRVPDVPPYPLGASYYKVDLQAGTTQWLSVDVAGDAGTRWGISWAVWPEKGAATTGWTLVEEGQPLTVEFDLAGGRQAEVAVVNAGLATLDANDARDLVASSFTVTFALVDPPPTDTGTTTTTPPTTTTPTDTGTPPTGTPTTDTNPGDTDAPTDPPPDEPPGGCGCASGGPAPAAALAGVALLVARRRPRDRRPTAGRHRLG